MKETELAQKFIEHFADWNLYYEVSSPVGSTDIVAIKHPVYISIEVKTSFSLAVIEQAVKNKPYYNYSYVAVPYSRNSYFAEVICKSYGIGVLKYKPDNRYGNHIFEAVTPLLNRKAPTKYIKLMDANLTAVPGCINGRPTPFKEMVKWIISYIQRHPGTPLNELFDSGFMNYRTLTAFKSGMYHWTKAGVIPEFYIKDGKVYLKE